MQVAKWGNSLAVRLPAALVQELGIADGDEILLQPSPGHAKQLVRVTILRQPDKLEQLLAARKFRAPWPVDFAVNREESNSR